MKLYEKPPLAMVKSDLGQYGINLVSCHGSLGFAAGNASIIKWILDSAALSVSLSFAERPGLILRVICFLRVSSSVLAGRK